ncbi:hypothetical protein ANANG_G00131520 [Anguilla anguilla]|uniref:Uncharacterized protein n=1 Tax=Anguilla anguilla TaxID=7936 RepID=A0A9D3RY17_ANGAN|nr:hypothetical protein ANANG_G00131520 [Anguilla anguilla]
MPSVWIAFTESAFAAEPRPLSGRGRLARAVDPRPCELRLECEDVFLGAGEGEVVPQKSCEGLRGERPLQEEKIRLPHLERPLPPTQPGPCCREPPTLL